MNVGTPSRGGRRIDLGFGIGHLWRNAPGKIRRTCIPERRVEHQKRAHPMKLKFRHKVFLTFLLNSLAVVICMVLIARYYAHRNFEEYLNKMEKERLVQLAGALSREYRSSGGWDLVLKKWGGLLEMASGGPGRPPKHDLSGKPPVHPPPLPPPGDEHPPPELASLLFFGPHEHPPHGDGPDKSHETREPRPLHGLPPGKTDMAPRIGLFDADKRPLTRTGPTSADECRLEAVIADGQTVGWLGIERRERPPHPLDTEFLRRQSSMFYSIGGVALLLALIVTFVLSRHLLEPLKELAQGTRALTSRRFETRIQVRSKDEFGQLASDFNDMAQALERYEQMRQQWMADISHELRTPLAILRGEIEAMQDGVREITPEALDSLHFEVQHVGRIVHDLHDLSLIESRTFDAEPEAVNPLEVLEETVRSFHTRFEQRGMKIETSGGGRAAIMADAGRLRQLYSNLMENALRYADAPGTLAISSGFEEGLISIQFEDTGPGAPEDSLGRLFDRLYRVDKARSRSQGGSGLGLAICKSIAECFGGRIEASNGPLGGLRVVVVFPVLPG